MSELLPRDHQLLADLERAFPSTSFVLASDKWMDFEKRSSLAYIPGDIESMRRLVRANKIKSLGSLNNEPHYSINRKKK